jgi:hypothetical protein
VLATPPPRTSRQPYRAAQTKFVICDHTINCDKCDNCDKFHYLEIIPELANDAD